LRRLEVGDAPALRRILNAPEVWRWWGDVEPAPAFPLSDDHDVVRFVIEVDGAVAGLVQFGEEADPKYKHASIDLFVDLLVQERGHHRMVIDPATKNAAAIRCYEKAGFRAVGVMRRSERDADGRGWHDGLLMEVVVD
jgi:aminoglycoside 6'-N-acetyltransferase